MPGLIRYITVFFSATDSFMILCNAFFRSRLYCSPVAWNFVTLTDSPKVERIQRLFATLRYFFLFSSIQLFIYFHAYSSFERLTVT
jgi:hypothetical protein